MTLHGLFSLGHLKKERKQKTKKKKTKNKKQKTKNKKQKNKKQKTKNKKQKTKTKNGYCALSQILIKLSSYRDIYPDIHDCFEFLLRS
jgi:hypothetical protein